MRPSCPSLPGVGRVYARSGPRAKPLAGDIERRHQRRADTRVGGTPAFDALLDLLNPFNRSWAKEAAAIVFILSNSLMRPPGQDKDVPSRSHSFDAGAAWMSFALQAQMSGWYTHGMVGVDFERAFAELDVPQGYRVECAVALGRIGDPAALPEGLRAREQPNDRQPLSAIAMEGRFKG